MVMKNYEVERGLMVEREKGKDRGGEGMKEKLLLSKY